MADAFPGNFAWSNATMVTAGMAPYGAVSAEEIDQAVKELSSRKDQNPAEAWREVWCDLGERIAKVDAQIGRASCRERV